MTLPWRPPTALAQLTEKPPDSGVLGVAQDDLAGTAQALVAAVRAEFGEDDELPDRATVLGRVVMVAALPVTATNLRGQDARHGAVAHDGAPRRHDLSVARSCPQQLGERHRSCEVRIRPEHSRIMTPCLES